mgnify:CR=1 FL=1
MDAYKLNLLDEMIMELLEAEYQRGLDEAAGAYDDGYMHGNDAGYDAGYQEGYDEGHSDGNDAGYELGYDEGHIDAFYEVKYGREDD